jgi:MoaA/NifB/PqqE/SkfB family radical SAM enzyme
MSSFTSLHLVAELTNRCNFSCLHCLRENNATPQPDLPLELYEKFLREARTYRSPYVTLTGGEPTLHQHLETVLALTAQYGYTFTIVTNGWTFKDLVPLFERFQKHLHAIIFSLDGAKEETHTLLRQQPESYQRILEACMICYYKQLPFRLSITLHRQNVDELEEFIRLASKLGAESVNIGQAQLTSRLVAQQLALSPQQRRQIHQRLLHLRDTAPLPVNMMYDYFVENPYFLCQTLLMSSIALDYRGRVRFCCQLSGYPADDAHQDADIIGDLRDASVWECHRRLVRKIAEFQQEKITRIEQNTLSENDHFPCYYCLKYFGKLGWLRDFPTSEWNDHEQ